MKASNKLLPIISGIVLFFVITGIFLFTQTDVVNDLNILSVKSKRAKEVKVDGDSAVDTLQTIAVDLADNKSKYKDVTETVDYQQQQLNSFNKKLKELSDTNAALKRKVAEQERLAEDNKKNSNVNGETFDVTKFKEDILKDIKKKLPKLPKAPEIVPDYDVNVLETVEGITGKTTVASEGNSSVTTNVIHNNKSETSTRVRSITLPFDKDGKVNPATLDKLLEEPQTETESSEDRSLVKSDEPVIDPRYTIFSNSILNDAVAVTTLIGRVPIQGDVRDPAPFKVVVGKENMTANGFDIPGLDGMIMSGTLFGDKTLECVRGSISTATYIFEDGRGITFPKRKNRKNSLGWISDSKGNPCIPGTYISNEKTQLRNRMLLASAAGAANAFSSAQTTTTVNSDGGSTTSITGDKAEYMLGTAISDATKELTDFLDRQRFDEWSSVVIPSGKKVAVHLEETLELDQSSLQRKVVYEQDNNATYGLTD